MPPLPMAGVPDSVAVPSPLSTKVTPLGRGPLSLSAALAGKLGPVVTMKLPGVPTPNVVLLALVIDGASLSVSVKVWVASGVTPLVAVMVNE